MAPDNQQDQTYRPLVLIGVVLGSLALFAVFFLGFLVAPLAVLAVFYLIFAASDRSKRSSPPPSDLGRPAAEADGSQATVTRGRLEHEAALRRAEIERHDEQRAVAAAAARPSAPGSH